MPLGKYFRNRITVWENLERELLPVYTEAQMEMLQEQKTKGSMYTRPRIGTRPSPEGGSTLDHLVSHDGPNFILTSVCAVEN